MFHISSGGIVVNIKDTQQRSKLLLLLSIKNVKFPILASKSCKPANQSGNGTNTHVHTYIFTHIKKKTKVKRKKKLEIQILIFEFTVLQQSQKRRGSKDIQKTDRKSAQTPTEVSCFLQIKKSFSHKVFHLFLA